MKSIRGLYSESAIFLDSNILVLLIAGQVRPNLLPKLSPGNIHFSIDDFELIIKILGQFKETRTTPYILTEVNSLLNSKLDHNSGLECREKFAEYIPLLVNTYTDPKKLAAHSLFSVFGLADISIVEACDNALVLTDDDRLIGLLKDSCNVLNYNTLKQLIEEN
ncbi:MAG: hypothetical protein ABI778_02660 [Ignavibacteriota bacterium]